MSHRSQMLSFVLLPLAIPTALCFAQTNDEDTATNIGAVLNFEAPQVHPIAMNTTGTRLLAVNTVDARLSVFDVTVASNPTLVSEIPVGIEPISVCARTADEAWVVNHTSDSVSVVSLSQGVVLDTIQCKDDPCDVVFAGSPQRAYVTLAGSREVRVYDVTSHALVATIPIQGLQPRALAVSADGTKVYAGIAMSGNGTTLVPASLAPPQPPPTQPVGPPPQVGLIVSATDPAWAASIPYTVLDHDVAEISTATQSVSRYFGGVGTTIFSLAVQPGTGDLFVANTDARNVVRFEKNLKGHAVDNLLSRIQPVTGAVTRFDLNPGLNYNVMPNLAAKATALAQPTDVIFNAAGSALYVASFGTDRVAKMAPDGSILARIEVGTATGSTVDPKNKKGPRGLALHPTGSRLYVLNRISNSISVISTTTDTVVLEVAVGSFDPTPATVKAGRGFLYDAKLSGNGTMSCASCHIDSESDCEDWDLGDPDGPSDTIPDPSNTYGQISMHPEKGPMFTQTLRGLAGNTPLHWRGDRTNFSAFNGAFSTLMGGSQLSAADMQLFSDFMMSAFFEPNPNLNLDRSLPATILGGNPTNGKNVFKTTSSVTPLGACNNCHHLPLGTGSKIVNKTVLGQAQGLKVPQLRTSYTKTGMFNSAPGAQSLGGFGFGHDGAVGTIEEFLSNPVTFGAMSATDKTDLASFLQCIDTGTPPAVGHSITVTSANVLSGAVSSELALLLGAVAAADIDLVAKGRTDGVLHGFVYVPATSSFQSDMGAYGPFTWPQLQAKIQAGGRLTLMGVPKGAGHRMGVDHNMNGIPDAEESSIIALEEYGLATPACAAPIHLAANSSPNTGNSNFAFNCTGLAPNQLSLLIATPGEGLEPGPDLFGLTLWLDLTQPEVYLLDLPADDLGFGYVKVPIPVNPPYLDQPFSAMVITLNPCTPFGIAGSHGVRFEVREPN